MLVKQCRESIVEIIINIMYCCDCCDFYGRLLAHYNFVLEAPSLLRPDLN